jgi:hypothetical protein
LVCVPLSYSSAGAATSSRQKSGMSETTQSKTEWEAVEKRRNGSQSAHSGSPKGLYPSASVISGIRAALCYRPSILFPDAATSQHVRARCPVGLSLGTRALIVPGAAHLKHTTQLAFGDGGYRGSAKEEEQMKTQARDCLETPNGLHYVVPRACKTGQKGTLFGAWRSRQTRDPTRPATFQTVSEGEFSEVGLRRHGVLRSSEAGL